MTIGNIISNLRKEQNMTQEALANALGVTNQAVSKWESDQSCPDISLLPTIADLFGVSIGYLFGRTDSRTASALSLPWENDATIRIVVYRGHTYLSNYAKADEIHVRLSDAVVQNVECAVSLTIDGNVYLNATAGGNLTCDGVMGSVQANGNVSCDEVRGSVRSGGSTTCDDVGGNVTAGGSVNCNDITGNVNAGGSVNCDNIEGSVTSSGTINNDKKHVIELKNGAIRINGVDVNSNGATVSDGVIELNDGAVRIDIE